MDVHRLTYEPVDARGAAGEVDVLVVGGRGARYLPRVRRTLAAGTLTSRYIYLCERICRAAMARHGFARSAARPSPAVASRRQLPLQGRHRAGREPLPHAQLPRGGAPPAGCVPREGGPPPDSRSPLSPSNTCRWAGST